MPTYEYECKKCKRHHEAFQSITAKPLSRCPRPRCRGTLKRLMGTGSGFIFKGSGFYITDYRSKSYKEAKQKDKAPSKTESPDSGSKPETKESKPAADSKKSSKS